MPEVADPLVAKEGGTYTHEGRGNFRTRNVVPAIAFSSKDHGQDAGEEIAPTMRAMNGEHANSGGQIAVAFQPRFARNDRGGPSEVAYPLTAEAGRTGKGDSAQAVIQNIPATHASHGWRVRRLTPTECARLQGQADNHCAIPWGGKPADECPDGPQYKAYGNSMSTNVMEWLGVRIQMVQDLIDEGAI
jgi:DNA (cytosine-5)-methyltransferase 1